MLAEIDAKEPRLELEDDRLMLVLSLAASGLLRLRACMGRLFAVASAQPEPVDPQGDDGEGDDGESARWSKALSASSNVTSYPTQTRSYVSQCAPRLRVSSEPLVVRRRASPHQHRGGQTNAHNRRTLTLALFLYGHVQRPGVCRGQRGAQRGDNNTHLGQRL